MNTTSLILLLGIIVVAGRWSQKKKFSGKVVVGLAFLIIALVVMAQVDDSIATKFSWLAVLTASFIYVPPLLSKLGLTSGGQSAFAKALT